MLIIVISFFGKIVFMAVKILKVISCIAIIFSICSWSELCAEEPKHQVTVEGIDSELKKNLLLSLDFTTISCERKSWWFEANQQKLLAKGQKSLQALGYFSAEITASFHLNETSKCQQINLFVKLNEPTLVSKIHIQWQGKDNFTEMESLALQEVYGMENQIFRSDVYESLKISLLKRLIAQGYVLAKFSKSRVEVQNNRAVINWVIDVNQKFRIRDIIVRQKPKAFWNENFIRAIAELQNDTELNRELLINAKNLLDSASLFTYADVQMDLKTAKEGLIDIIIDVTAKKNHEYQAGVGFSTDLGPRVRLKYKNNRINPLGHRYQAESFFSKDLSQISSSYHIPSLQEPSRHYYELGLGGERKTIEEVDSTSYVFRADDVRQLSNGWKRIYNGEFLSEDFTVVNDRGEVFLALPGVSLEKIQSDKSIYPLKSYHYRFSAQAATQSLFSDLDMFQVRLRAVRTKKISSKNRLIYRLETGYTWVDDFNQLPPSKRFYAGGTDNIRGYSFESLGPTDTVFIVDSETGLDIIEERVTGGKNLLIASVELDYRIAEKWVVAIFFDAGNAFNNQSFDVKKGTGMGIRWFSPAGPLKLDLGFPLDKPNDGWQVHFSLGVSL